MPEIKMDNRTQGKNSRAPYASVHDYQPRRSHHSTPHHQYPTKHTPVPDSNQWYHSNTNESHKIEKMAPDRMNQPIVRKGEKPSYYSANPYQNLVHPVPVDTRLSAGSLTFQDMELQIPYRKFSISLQCIAGLLSVLCAALFTPFGATHSDLIHGTSFIFGLIFIAVGIANFRCFSWKSSTSVKVCVGANALGNSLAFAAIVLGILSLFETFQGKGAESRVAMRDEHYDIATQVLTAFVLLASIIEIGSTTYVLYHIAHAWRKKNGEMALPVNV